MALSKSTLSGSAEAPAAGAAAFLCPKQPDNASVAAKENASQSKLRLCRPLFPLVIVKIHPMAVGLKPAGLGLRWLGSSTNERLPSHRDCQTRTCPRPESAHPRELTR